MRWETVALLVFGFLCGMTVMYILNRRQRIQEFNKIAEITEDILNERKVQAFSTGEETLYSKLEHQLVRVQEMLQGRSEEAERSRDEIQKLISQIAHQMRTPLMNMETYIGFLEDGKEQMSEELFFQSVDALKNSQGKLGFLVESFIRMARLEQHILQIKKEEPDLLKTVRNGFGQIQRRAEEKEIHHCHREGIMTDHRAWAKMLAESRQTSGWVENTSVQNRCSAFAAMPCPQYCCPSQ